MKPQIIELEDGSKWELATNHIRPDSNSNLVLFRFTRLPPENPMPELKRGYIVDIGMLYTVVVLRVFSNSFYVGDVEQKTVFDCKFSEILTIGCPTNGLIWSKEGKI